LQQIENGAPADLFIGKSGMDGVPEDKNLLDNLNIRILAYTPWCCRES